jgi:predicted regulator of Ras-like GTPase activity (Roadblock/LC7/MglB family)
MNDRLTEAVEQLSRIPGVTGALLVDAEAGLPVVGELADDAAAPAVAALAAAAYRRTGRALNNAKLGRLEMFRLEAAGGNVLITDGGGLLVVVIAEPQAHHGRVQVEALQVAEALS